MKTLRCAVIGLGAIHMNHIRAIRNLENVELAAICDIDEALLHRKQEEFSCPGYTDYKEMIDQVRPDVVHVLTPHYLHAPMAVYAMEQGAHVLTEKPMAIHEADARMMIETAERTGKQLGVCFQNRYNPTSQRIRALLDNGSLGALKSIKMSVTWNRDEAYYAQAAWRGTWSMEGGGVLINQSIHTLDLMQWFAGPMESVAAQTACFRLPDAIEVEDTAHGYLHFCNGATGIFYATNAFGADAPVELDLVLEHGRILMKDDLTITYDDGSVERMDNTSLLKGEKGYWGTGHETLIRDFYSCVRENRPFPIDGKEGCKVIHLIEGIYHAAATGQTIHL